MNVSEFASLWIDKNDALEKLEQFRGTDTMIATYYEKLKFFIENGYVVFEGAVSHDVIDRYLEAFEKTLSEDSGMVASVPAYGPQDKSIIPAQDALRGAPLTKYLDTYWMIEEALPVIFNQCVREFLSTIFQDDAFAFQGLHFEVGSTQAMHQDTAYVVVLEKPLALAASWCALEDIVPGSGELMYFEGSHKLPDWKYSGAFKHFNHARDPHEQHTNHLDFIKQESKRREFNLRHFLPKKGDVLIWAADLAHGGSRIEKNDVTRKSLVTHYCPSNLRPNYFRYLSDERQVIRNYPNLGRTSTFYYDPKPAKKKLWGLPKLGSAVSSVGNYLDNINKNNRLKIFDK